MWDERLIGKSVECQYTVQTADLNLPCIRRIPKMHSCIENKFMLRRLLCIMGLFLPPNFTLSSLLRFGSDPGSNPEEDK
jgi:hypothetical protein